MDIKYAIKVLEEKRNNLDDMLDQIAEGHYNHHSEQIVN